MDNADKKTCGAKNRQGNPCKNSPVKGRERCRYHGGLTPEGQHKGNSHASRHGLYSNKFTEEEIAKFPDLYQSVGELEEEIVLIRIRIARILDLGQRIDSGQVQAGMPITEIRRIQRQNIVGISGKDKQGNPIPVLDSDQPNEDHVIRKLPDIDDLLIRYTGRLAGLIKTMHGVHWEVIDRLKAELTEAIDSVNDEKRRLQQFSVIQGRDQA